ncbi:MAG: hypothetical protein CMP22_04545 [Rickettsiales bacterium]|nr:hypothetical protein [Rickettsiales bacterium]|tara:strand:- start:868 stop:1194 length:327 start_codon:yes stop_codon:yes gene_type:complete
MPDVGGVSGDRLRSFIERIERLDEERKVIAEDIKEVYGEAKAVGFDPKIIRKVIKLRKMDKEARLEEDQLTDLYLVAIGDALASMEENAAALAMSEANVTDPESVEAA